MAINNKNNQSAKRVLMQCIDKAKRHEREFGVIDTLVWIALWYKYAPTAQEKAAWHIIIRYLHQKFAELQILPKLPNIE